MAKQLSGRVAALERRARAGRGGRCRACGGLGRVAAQVRFRDEPPPEPEGCPRCGLVAELLVVHFVDGDDDHDDVVGDVVADGAGDRGDDAKGVGR